MRTEKTLQNCSETYQRLAIAVETKLSEVVTAKSLWGKNDNITTDSVSKNFCIGNLVEKIFYQNIFQITCFVMCIVVEKFDDPNLKVLADIEGKLTLRERLEKSTLHFDHFSEERCCCCGHVRFIEASNT